MLGSGREVRLRTAREIEITLTKPGGLGIGDGVDGKLLKWKALLMYLFCYLRYCKGMELVGIS